MTQEITLVTPEDLDNTTVVVNSSNKVEVVTASAAVKGVAALATSPNFPETGNTKAVTPDYLQAALAAMPDIFE